MFCIYNNELKIAPPNVSYSHAVWFEKEGWITNEDETLMTESVRGYVDKKGNIYFYTGYDFRINSKIEKIFFNYLDELKYKLDLENDCKVFGGRIQVRENKWKGKKKY